MGAINYKTSDYITMAIKPYEIDGFETDEEFEAECAELGKDKDEYIEELIRQYYEDDFYNIKNELEKHYFDYFHINIEYGYYEGFSLNIEFNYPVAFDNWEDRRAANKEITEIKEFLKNCAGMGMVACHPSWCTAYLNYDETLRSIDVAISEMRDTVSVTPTWRQYNKGA